MTNESTVVSRRPDVVHDPLYGPFVLDPTAQALVDTAEYQRLRRIRQLAMASEVYPSAMHTRFEHAVGVYRLSKFILDGLAEREELEGIDEEDRRLVRYACLLHDLGHFSGAHLLEEIHYPGASHERAGEDWFTHGDIGKILKSCGIPNAARRIAAMVQHKSDEPLAGIVSGDCDADKMDYILRDPYHCGLPKGYDQEYLRHSIALVKNPATGLLEIGIDIRGLPAFEAMLYSKFNLYRAVYFHPVARAATAMMRSLLVSALDLTLLSMEELHRWTDDEVFVLLQNRVGKKKNAHAKQVRSMINRLLSRSLYRPSCWLPLSDAPDGVDYRWLSIIEARIEKELGLNRGEVLVDIPSKPTMLSTNILVRQTDGSIVPATELGPDMGFALQTAKEAFYAASGRIHLFTPTAVPLSQQRFRELLTEPFT